jgi:hypothetical protein
MDIPQTPIAPADPMIPEDATFLALANAGRRQLLRRLAVAGTGGLTAGEASGRDRKQRDIILKNLALLVGLHLVQTATDTRDARKTRYNLSPLLTTRRTETGWELDFGCTVLRWSTGEESAPYPKTVRTRRCR